MKKIFTIILIGMVILSHAQEQQGLKDLYNLEVGFLGAWVNYEKVVSEKIAINTEFGYAGGILKPTNNHTIDYVFTTVFSVEPRYYYNLNKRINKAKNTTNNSANYFTVELYYVPNWLTQTNRTNLDINSDFSIIPKWGFRRNIAPSLNFDFAIGVGYSSSDYIENHLKKALDIRLSYTF